jgi:hypothetical protein
MARAKATAKTEVKPIVDVGYSEKIDTFLKERLADRYYYFWQQFTGQFPLPFHRPSSSSGKYHQSTAGTVDNLEEHTMDLMQFVDKLARTFGDTKEEQFYDIVLLAAALHDVQKYGDNNSLKHTTKEHGVITAKAITDKGEEFGLTAEEAKMLSDLVLYHDGRWNSTNPGFKPIAFTQLQLFLHLADMASSRRILKFD